VHIDSRLGERPESWSSGNAYEPYIGRWSRRVAAEFLPWLDIPADSNWLDVGCGTGAVSETILQTSAPKQVTGIDRSEDYISFARAHIQDKRAEFKVGDAQALPVEAATADAAVSALMLNFVPRPEAAAAELKRAIRPEGTAAAYVWDYGGNMQFLRYFWDAAAELDPAARDLDEGRRFPLCRPEPMRQLFIGAGFRDVEVRPIDAATDFRDFDDLWQPFLGGQGPAPTYVQSLSEARKAALRERTRSSLPIGTDGSIHLTARAWAVRGRR
jgi:SAM-dependent methyltransferase